METEMETEIEGEIRLAFSSRNIMFVRGECIASARRGFGEHLNLKISRDVRRISGTARAVAPSGPKLFNLRGGGGGGCYC
jgi:hypothetical protein